MVERDDLEALDVLLWLGTGELAAAWLGCHQATVSRRLARCRETFGLDLRRLQGDWQCAPNALLDLERRVHQLSRFLGQRPLRIDGFPVGSDPLLQPPPAGWAVGRCDLIGVARPLRLLRERVIDAWLSDAPQDIRCQDLDGLALRPLWQAPVQLVASAAHPLAGERGLGPADLLRFPSLDLPAEGYPRSSQLLHSLGFGNQPMALRRLDLVSWQDLTADQVLLSCSTPLHRPATPKLRLLDAAPLFWSGGVLVVLQDQADQPALLRLEDALRRRLKDLAPSLPECALA